MMVPLNKRRGPRGGASRERGMTLVELMIAAFILAIGLAGIGILFTTVALATQRTKLDTNSTLVAKLVMEQITEAEPNTTTVVITDCAGNANTLNITGAASTASPPGAGALLATASNSTYYGGIDFTQDYSGITSGYKMKYVDCGGTTSGGGGYTSYDVRWNIINYGTDSSGNVTARLVTVGAHQYNVSKYALGHLYFAFPVSLRSVGGPSQ
ncbi:MAG TPA: prepilin-type N-terminal cleavage/methylation domain-containing protein [Candidatus Koribacter sp.]|jgi:prepilin-type N-terminal cleavage/methylation domain-containing protein